MHIAISTQGFVSWGGGVGFIENILIALTNVPDKIERITVFIPNQPTTMRLFASKVKRALYDPKNALQHLTSSYNNQEPWKTAINVFGKICTNTIIYNGKQAALNQLCKSMKVDVLLPSIEPLINFETPWVGYLFDCQHKHLPCFFSTHEAASRDQAFNTMLNTATHVIVNANTVVQDLELFYPRTSAKLIALPFTPVIRIDDINTIIGKTKLIQNKYKTGGKYLIISNQFWIHKDHSTAFRAYAKIIQKQDFKDYKLVCTGAQEDYRFPNYFKDLLALIHSLEIQSHVIFTGYISKEEQLALLNGASLMLQPTLFEGGPGGGATFDAVALGIPSIISDIPVNLEITDPLVNFFTTGDDDNLADLVMELIIFRKQKINVDSLILKNEINIKILGSALYDTALLSSKKDN
jgi:glycosyltransferase involved in cell wall biosynthesis